MLSLNFGLVAFRSLNIKTVSIIPSLFDPILTSFLLASFSFLQVCFQTQRNVLTSKAFDFI